MFTCFMHIYFFAPQLQQAEAEELRQREANLTALAAIGPRKKRKLDFSDSSNPGVCVSFRSLPLIVFFVS